MPASEPGPRWGQRRGERKFCLPPWQPLLAAPRSGQAASPSHQSHTGHLPAGWLPPGARRTCCLECPPRSWALARPADAQSCPAQVGKDRWGSRVPVCRLGLRRQGHWDPRCRGLCGVQPAPDGTGLSDSRSCVCVAAPDAGGTFRSGLRVTSGATVHTGQAVSLWLVSDQRSPACRRYRGQADRLTAAQAGGGHPEAGRAGQVEPSRPREAVPWHQ